MGRDESPRTAHGHCGKAAEASRRQWIPPPGRAARLAPIPQAALTAPRWTFPADAATPSRNAETALRLDAVAGGAQERRVVAWYHRFCRKLDLCRARGGAVRPDGIGAARA